ncbi:signal peptide peptidase SppA [Alkalihalobacillus oceani]|uniref:signal peptide peptidase SppA n=1 Tax=Halalkalibacter oceani TaxID=1653776 RepID=UPI00203AAC85|nr:signal peptide peptidase SppA [Halalkalibacter oceani]MCM3759640.1 signal peptide peptidase SppA [Halalkalibacter oceani]
MSRKRWLALIAVAMLLVASAAINVATATIFSESSAWGIPGGNQWDETIVERGEDGSGFIALLDVNGVLQDNGETGWLQTSSYNHRLLLSQLEHAAKDPAVEGIVLRVNTPGGGVVESAEIHQKIIEAQEEYGKPVFVSMGSMAASGGYYIAAPATQIIASPQTITGSIGVIMESINVAELAENYGVKVNTIKSGPYKDIMSATREMTEEDRAILQALIDESYDEFVSVIANGRGMAEEEVRRLADGRIYSGAQALELNLVDQLGSLDDTIVAIKDYLGADYSVVQYETSLGFPQLFSMSVNKMLSSEDELAGLHRLLTEHRAPTLKYLYTN